ncbi:hypothetical protein LCW13_05795 [Cobetia amphilecti]|uniref:hypothetical protein n=1 Tax=Cobetia amphilecti TaxID=1055104 RepID=UPI001CDAE35E|nr:hypothetical protein [Cobetia amphilecti]UBU49768.1 hypothetical protein LCW13_05795 [Cobetia amphilecti]
MSNEQYLTDLFIYQAELLAKAPPETVEGNAFEIEYDGGVSGHVSITGLMADALKRLRKAEADRDRLKAELEDRSHEPEMTASDAYHHCADLIEPHVVDLPHGTECNEQSLCRSVCGSLAYLIEHWQEARGLREERDALEALIRTVIDEAIHCGADASFDNFIENNPIASAASDYAALRDTRLENTKTHLVAITEQRDALVAHVGELVKSGRTLHDELQQWALTERDPDTSAAMAAWRSVVNENPGNSSARLHSRIQELEASGNGLYVAFEALLPGLKHIALQDYSVINEAPIRWTRAVSATGTDALARRDARMKAEALEALNPHDLSRFAKSIGEDAWDMNPVGICKLVNRMATLHREQAEGGDQ